MSSAAPAVPAAAPTTPISVVSAEAKKDIDQYGDYSASAKQVGAYLLGMIRDPKVLSAFFAFWFLFSFFSILITSGVNSLTANSPQPLQVWWVGTLLSSILVLLLFYLVFHSSSNFNRGMVLLLLSTLIITHISLLVTQINLRVT